MVRANGSFHFIMLIEMAVAVCDAIATLHCTASHFA